jgi:hypothetical protein
VPYGEVYNDAIRRTETSYCLHLALEFATPTAPVAQLTVWVSTAEVLARKSASELYTALILCVPRLKVEITKNPQFKQLRTKLLKGAAGFYADLEKLLVGQTDFRSRKALAAAYRSASGFVPVEAADCHFAALRKKSRE